MQFKDLVIKHRWEEIEPRFRELYYDPNNKDVFFGEKLNKKQREARIKNNMKGYHLVFELLKLKQKRLPKDRKPITIQITKIEKDYDETILEHPWYNVTGINGDTYLKDDKYFKDEYERQIKNGELKDNYEKMANEQISYAIEFSSWCVWNGMNIDQKNIDDIGEIDIICHCLWEMTFFGFRESRIRSVMKELDKRVESIKDGTAKFVNWEDIKEKIKNSISKESKKSKGK